MLFSNDILQLMYMAYNGACKLSKFYEFENENIMNEKELEEVIYKAVKFITAMSNDTVSEDDGKQVIKQLEQIKFCNLHFVMPRSIHYNDIDRCCDTLFKYIEKHENWFDRKNYIGYMQMIAETIELEKKLNGA